MTTAGPAPVVASTDSAPAVTLADHWSALAAAALLGTDRHPVPAAPAGPVADLLAARPGHDRADDALDQVAALAVMRRAGVRPNGPAPLLVACPLDLRPECPPAAVVRLARLLDEWPHLLDEWLARVLAGGWCLSPEVAVALLRRLRADPARRAVVAELAGELAAWLAELLPAEFAPRRPPSGGPGAKTPAAPAASPPMPDDLARLAGLPPAEIAASLAHGLQTAALGNHLRAPLVALVSRLGIDQLAAVAEALSRSATNAKTMGLALTLADLAQFRLDLISELT